VNSDASTDIGPAFEVRNDPCDLASPEREETMSRTPADALAAGEHRTRRRKGAGRLLDLKEAETYSGISAWTLRELIASGDLPAVRPPRLRRLWIDRADLDKAIAQWKDR
jgi:excisionase family DNA binding protein